jgi:parallel beta-helix repeat protein
VAPDGSPRNDGSSARPLDLATALSSASPAAPCDTVWLRGGTYRGVFTSVLRGREGAPIIVRQAAGERATIDSAPERAAALSVNGAHVWFWGLEITNSDPLRTSTETTSWPSDLKRASGVIALGSHLKFINMVVHDMTRGFEFGVDALDVEVYGSLIFYNGWETPQHTGNGSGIDTHNRVGTRRLADNIIFDQFSQGISAYGSAPEVNLQLEGNILFNNGSLSRSDGRDVLIGGRGAKAPILLDNMTYGGAQTHIGYGAGCVGARIEGNYLASTVPLILTQCDGVVKDNTFVGTVGTLLTSYPENTYRPKRPTGVVIRVRRNQYEPGRANIGVYNWDKKAEIDLDLSGVGLTPGDEYEIRDAKNFFGAPLTNGAWAEGGKVAVRVEDLTAAMAPIGTGLAAPAHTAPEFITLVVVPVPPASEAPLTWTGAFNRVYSGLMSLARRETPPRAARVIPRPPRGVPRHQHLYVAPDGQTGASGSREEPLRLDVALSARSPARPGDTIWLRGGTYHGAFVSALSGEPGSPITVRQYPGERAVIDTFPSPANALTVMGAWTEFWGFEITSSDPTRRVSQPGSWPTGLRRGSGVDAHGPHNKFINLVIHDMSGGLGIWADSEDTSVYGNVIFYNGWQGPDRSHGHGIYTQNQTGSRELADNIVFDQFSHGIHAYGSSAAYLDNITLRGNVVFNNGALADSGAERDILLGGGRVARNAVIEGNATYGPGQSNVGYAAGCQQSTISNNYFVGAAPLILESCLPTMTGNTFVGPMREYVSSVQPRNRYFPTPPRGLVSFVRVNRYDPTLASIVIYNWDQSPEVAVDLSSALKDGSTYEILDAQNYFGPPVLTGSYTRGALTAIPMTGQSVALAVGNVSRQPRHTGPEFGVFVLRIAAAHSPGPR